MHTTARSGRPADAAALGALGALALALPAAVALPYLLASSIRPPLALAAGVALLVAAAALLEPRVDPRLTTVDGLLSGVLTALLAVPATAGYIVVGYVVSAALEPPAGPGIA